MKRDELMPCPFCGDDDVSYVSRDVGVVCNGCGATGPHDQPAAVWNQRSALDARCGSGVAEQVAYRLRTGSPQRTWQWMDGKPSVGAIREAEFHGWKIEYAYSKGGAEMYAPPPPAATPKVCTNCASDGRCMKRQALCEFTKSQQPKAQAGEDTERWREVARRYDASKTSDAVAVLRGLGLDETPYRSLAENIDAARAASRAEGGDA